MPAKLFGGSNILFFVKTEPKFQNMLIQQNTEMKTEEGLRIPSEPVIL